MNFTFVLFRATLRQIHHPQSGLFLLIIDYWLLIKFLFWQRIVRIARIFFFVTRWTWWNWLSFVLPTDNTNNTNLIFCVICVLCWLNKNFVLSVLSVGNKKIRWQIKTSCCPCYPLAIKNPLAKIYRWNNGKNWNKS